MLFTVEIDVLYRAARAVTMGLSDLLRAAGVAFDVAAPAGVADVYVALSQPERRFWLNTGRRLQEMSQSYAPIQCGPTEYACMACRHEAETEEELKAEKEADRCRAKLTAIDRDTYPLSDWPSREGEMW